MAEFVLVLILAFPAILGLAEMLHFFKKWILFSGDKGRKILILVPENKNFQRQMLSSFEDSKWQGEGLAKEIIVLDTCLSEENKEECRLLAEKLGFKLCDKLQLSSLEF